MTRYGWTSTTPVGWHRAIATTQNMNAAKLTVDFWRNVYTLNYDVLRLPGGGFAGMTEPSVSLWQPSTPKRFRA